MNYVPSSPAASATSIDKLETQVDTIVASVAGALGIHDEHDDGAKNGIDVLVDLGCKIEHFVHGFFHGLAFVLQVCHRVDDVLNDECCCGRDILVRVRY